ncbi:thiamine ABC transporter substrate binding subunit [Phyllobacterium endophyticum]|uniref:Thiamine ABC transporter substrate binding subunit n=1 Tax=Phyllobacterium endophyticum TaxID=1149773 RepID=A0A2P7AYG6_9HYPH|nr:thiamine ABC transporter substrate binding subunit [Phyllobacterium endophyticum]MBB3236187.1 thiamine transport system substrate-binding protein [Phyllobacterium endophyticum]PSH59269.1 thiamine ABC transporter substrate binding subunit [Phyllobacterium endophyticum]TYR41394.1 thiamine ABC transporter substrate binding subunit [Phyllobacterium endophyticum]
MRPFDTVLRPFITACILALALAVPAKADGKLTVYTYESFTAEWGPGPKIKQAFEKQCSCSIDFVAVTDGVALLNRLRLEGKSTKADVVLGLDTNLTHEAKETGLFAPHAIDTSSIEIPGGYKDDTFVPYDYGYFAVIYDTHKMKDPPASLKQLVEGGPKDKIVIEDPRTSTPGLGLLLWVKSVYGDKAGEAWARLKDRVLTVAPGWSEAYGLFTKGEAPLVLSYTTSPAYHIIAEKNDRYKAAAFEEGHYLQVEVAAQTANGAKNPLSAQFLAFITSPAFQDTIPESNWMFPAAKTSGPLNPAFDTLVKPAKTLIFSPEEVARNRKAWIEEWLSAMSL